MSESEYLKMGFEPFKNADGKVIGWMKQHGNGGREFYAESWSEYLAPQTDDKKIIGLADALESCGPALTKYGAIPEEQTPDGFADALQKGIEEE